MRRGEDEVEGSSAHRFEQVPEEEFDFHAVHGRVPARQLQGGGDEIGRGDAVSLEGRLDGDDPAAGPHVE